MAINKVNGIHNLIHIINHELPENEIFNIFNFNNEVEATQTEANLISQESEIVINEQNEATKNKSGKNKEKDNERVSEFEKPNDLPQDKQKEASTRKQIKRANKIKLLQKQEQEKRQKINNLSLERELIIKEQNEAYLLSLAMDQAKVSHDIINNIIILI